MLGCPLVASGSGVPAYPEECKVNLRKLGYHAARDIVGISPLWLQWSEDSKRVVAVGDGKEAFAKV